MSRSEDPEAPDEFAAFGRYAAGDPVRRLRPLPGGRLRPAFRKRAPMPRLGAPQTADAPAAAPEEAGPAPEKQQELTWFEVQLTDENGEVLAGARYKAELPDGSPREGKLDARGRLRLDGIPAGECKVSFPDLEKSAA